MPLPNVPRVPADQVPPQAYVLDVREPVEWAAGHIEGAVHIPLSQLGARVSELSTDELIHVVCKVGARSEYAATALVANGWQAANVDGGMLAWAAAGRPMVSETAQPPAVV